jgi:glutathione S-transferase
VITLYHCARARSFRVLWMLEELRLPYELRMLPFPPRVFAKEYLQVNPLGTIPLLLDGDVRMTESSAIGHYLAGRHPDSGMALAPDEPGYADYLNLVSFGEATLTFPLAIMMRYTRVEPEPRRLPQAVEDYRRFFLGRLRAVDQRLQAGNEHLCGGRFTAADVSVGYALLFAEVVGIRGDLPPAVQAYLDRLKAREGFLRAVAAERSGEAALGIAGLL